MVLPPLCNSVMQKGGFLSQLRHPPPQHLNGIIGRTRLNPTTGISAKGKLEAVWHEKVFCRVHANLDMPASR